MSAHAKGCGLDSPYAKPHSHGLPWSTHESGRYEQRLRREQREAADARSHSYPMRGLRFHPGTDGGYHWNYERPFPGWLRWLARLVKRNTIWCSFYLQFGFSFGAVMRWKVVYAPTWITSIAQLTGEHPIAVAEHYIKTGAEIVSAVPEAANSHE